MGHYLYRRKDRDSAHAGVICRRHTPLLSGLILVGFFLLRGYQLPEWKVLKRISVQGIFLICISNGLLTWSLEYITGGLAAIIAALVPLFVVMFTMWLSKCAKITRWMIVGLVVGFLGVLTIFYDYLGQMQNKSFLFGVGLALAFQLFPGRLEQYTRQSKNHPLIFCSAWACKC